MLRISPSMITILLAQYFACSLSASDSRGCFLSYLNLLRLYIVAEVVLFIILVQQFLLMQLMNMWIMQFVLVDVVSNLI